MNPEPQQGSTAPTKKADTNPFGIFIHKPRRKFRRWLIVGCLVLIAAAGVLAKLKLLPAGGRIKDQLAAQLRVGEIIALENAARQEQRLLLENFNALAKKAGVDAGGWDFSAPTAEQLRTLRRQAPAADDLLAAYLAKRDEYAALKRSIHDLETRLGNPRLVRPGDTHFKMAYDFLISQTGLADEEVRRILQRTRLQEPLLPGFKVWNFWLADGFSTFVTQGDAPLTMEEATRQAMENQRQEKEQALAALNSLSLIIGTVKDLQSRQILVGGFLKSTHLGEIPASAFRQTMDLRNQRNIRIQAASLHLLKIDRVAVFPGEFRFGIDYDLRIRAGGRWAVLTIRRVDAFRGRRVVIAVE
jgi:hypothetical protein